MSRKSTSFKREFKEKMKGNYNKPTTHGTFEYDVNHKKVKVDTTFYLRKDDKEDLACQVESLSLYLKDETPKEKIFDCSLVSDSVLRLKYLGKEGDCYRLATC